MLIPLLPRPLIPPSPCCVPSRVWSQPDMSSCAVLFSAGWGAQKMSLWRGWSQATGFGGWRALPSLWFNTRLGRGLVGSVFWEYKQELWNAFSVKRVLAASGGSGQEPLPTERCGRWPPSRGSAHRVLRSAALRRAGHRRAPHTPRRPGYRRCGGNAAVIMGWVWCWNRDPCFQRVSAFAYGWNVPLKITFPG